MVRAEVFDSSGRLVSTIAQEGMIRVPTRTARGSGRWEIRMTEEDGDSGRWRVRMGEGDDGSAIPS